MRQWVDLEKARQLIQNKRAQLPPVKEKLTSASGRVLAEKIYAPQNQPPFSTVNSGLSPA